MEVTKNDLKKRQFPIEYSFDWEYGVKTSKIREDLDAIEKLGGNNIDINSYMSYDSTYIEFKAVDERIETQSECDERIAEEKSRLNHIKMNELNQLKILKEKYE